MSSTTVKPPLPFYGHTLSDLNNYLSDKTYVNNAVYPTQLDRELFEKVSKESKIQTKSHIVTGVSPPLPHLFRWFKHISSFSSEERISFFQNSSTVNIGNVNLPSPNLDLSIAQLDARVRTTN